MHGQRPALHQRMTHANSRIAQCAGCAGCAGCAAHIVAASRTMSTVVHFGNARMTFRRLPHINEGSQNE
jgi:hypothetical protein